MSSRHVGSALKLSAAETGPALLALGEDQWFERKSARISASALANTIMAFANAEGGTIVVGLHNGRVEGVDTKCDVNALRQASIDFTEPPVRVSHTSVACTREDGGGDHLLVFEIEPSELVHRNRKDEVYLRVGDESRKLTYAQRQELIYDKGQASFDGELIDGVTSADFDWGLLQNYADAVGSTDKVRLLRARGLVTRDDRVTAAGCLLFAEHPQTWFPSAVLRILRYRGRERGTGSRQNLDADEDIRIEGPIPRMLIDARTTVERLQPARQVLGAGGTFVREGVVPQDAWLEGVVNAVVHRSYSIGGDHVRVEIFDDRIEVRSPGRFPGLVRLDDPLRIDRFARNPRIARVCADLKWSEELGEGIKRMYTEMRAAGLLDPLYRQSERSVTVTLTASSAGGGAPLPALSREILEVVREAGGISTGDVTDMVRRSRPTVLRHLQDLAGAGLIERVGKAPKDPRAYWRLRSE